MLDGIRLVQMHMRVHEAWERDLALQVESRSIRQFFQTRVAYRDVAIRFRRTLLGLNGAPGSPSNR
ncbi:hypothetical protein D3C71_1988050 [compost metagenome]